MLSGTQPDPVVGNPLEPGPDTPVIGSESSSSLGLGARLCNEHEQATGRFRIFEGGYVTARRTSFRTRPCS